MKNSFIQLFSALFISFFFLPVFSQEIRKQSAEEPIDKVQALKDTLVEMINRSENELFSNHCRWFIKVIESQDMLTSYDNSILSATYDSFCNNNSSSDCRKFSAYLNRNRPLIISWESPTDGKVSLAALTLPIDWNPEKTYPLYIHLHGLSNTTSLPIDFLCRYFLRTANSSYSYEDGYLLMPWGRGNLWYQGISETDIWECKTEVEQLVHIDPNRNYITGHSMGGYGAWYIASRSPETWAAMGIEAGALWYDSQKLLRNEVVQQLKDIPAYFVTGTQDGLMDVDLEAYYLLKAAGNENTNFVTFEGGHEHLDSNDELLYLWLKEFSKDSNTGIWESATGKQTGLNCFPNPVCGTTKFYFSIDKTNHVRLSIYSIEGKIISTLINETLMQGDHEINFDATTLKSGVYFCRLEIDREQFQNHIIVAE